MPATLMRNVNDAFLNGLVFGFDVGTGSIGYAVRRGKEFLDVSVIICPEDTSDLKTRRGLRRQRRTLRSKKYRRQWLRQELEKLGLRWPRFDNRGPALDAWQPVDEDGRPLHVVRKNKDAFKNAQWELALMNFRVLDAQTRQKRDPCTDFPGFVAAPDPARGILPFTQVGRTQSQCRRMFPWQEAGNLSQPERRGVDRTKG